VLRNARDIGSSQMGGEDRLFACMSCIVTVKVGHGQCLPFLPGTVLIYQFPLFYRLSGSI
jgi:hypothetical protein